jgi:putative Holliday junction resolvase
MVTVALDLGRRRIGVAISAGGVALGAQPLGTIERRSFARLAAELKSMLEGRDVERIVVGLPLNMDGSEGPAARSARAFAARLATALGVAVDLFDERLTSFEAEERLKGLAVKRRRKKSAVDALAAAVILDGWLASHHRGAAE